jgi:hypothetical protein
MRWCQTHVWILVGLSSAILLSAGCSQSIEAPKSFQKFQAKDGSFSCLAPDGWDISTGGRSDNTYGWGKFAKGSAEIKITADVAGSLMADIQRGGNRDENSQEEAVASVHEMNRKNVAEDFDQYKEKPAKKITNAQLGEGRQGDFTAAGSMGSTIRGSRTTLLSNDRRITIICQCPSSQWKTLKPAFTKVIASVGR